MVGCGLAALVNPYGFDVLLFPFRVVQDKFLMDHIAEYLSPNFHAASALPLEILLLGAIALFAVSKRRVNIIELALILLFGHMALFSSRHMPLMAIVAAPILLGQADFAFNQLNGRLFVTLRDRLARAGRLEEATTRFAWPAAGVALVSMLALTGTIQHSFSHENFPTSAVNFIQREQITGNMFNNDEFGDYMIYAAWPAYKVFIDGRTDMYGAARVKEYLRVVNANNGWQDVLEKHDITWVFQGPNTVLSKLLLERDDWKLIYADKVAHIHVKVLPLYDRILRKYPAVQPVADEIAYTN
jgi:hypothetical protein